MKPINIYIDRFPSSKKTRRRHIRRLGTDQEKKRRCGSRCPARRTHRRSTPSKINGRATKIFRLTRRSSRVNTSSRTAEVRIENPHHGECVCDIFFFSMGAHFSLPGTCPPSSSYHSYRACPQRTELSPRFIRERTPKRTLSSQPPGITKTRPIH